MGEVTEPRTTRNPRQRLPTKVFGVFVLVAVFLQVSLEISPLLGRIYVSSLFVLLLWFPLVLVHELGHAIAAVVLGFEVREFGLGSYRLGRVGDALRFRRDPKPGSAGWIRIQNKNERALIPRRIIVYAGGAIANLLTGVALLVIALRVEMSVELKVIIAGSGFFSVYIALSNLLPQPWDRRKWPSDGKNIRAMLLGGESVELDRAFDALSDALNQDVRPRDLDPELVDRVVSLSPGSPRHTFARLIAYLHAIDRGDVEAATPHIECVQQTFATDGGEYLDLYLREIAFFHAFYRRDVPAAERFNQRLRHLPSHPACRLRVDAAIHLAAGLGEEARLLAERGLATLEGVEHVGQTAMEVDFLRAIVADATADTIGAGETTVLSA